MGIGWFWFWLVWVKDEFGIYAVLFIVTLFGLLNYFGFINVVQNSGPFEWWTYTSIQYLLKILTVYDSQHYSLCGSNLVPYFSSFFTVGWLVFENNHVKSVWYVQIGTEVRLALQINCSFLSKYIYIYTHSFIYGRWDNSLFCLLCNIFVYEICERLFIVVFSEFVVSFKLL